MNKFPRTTVAGISMPRMIIGTNWFFGYSHQTSAKDKFIRSYQTQKNIADILEVFLRNGIDAMMFSPNENIYDAIRDAEDRTGRKVIRVMTPSFNILPGGPPENEPERMLDICMKKGAAFCMPHMCVTDALVDRMHNVIRDFDKYSKMMRDRGMIPGLSTHMPETVVIADKSGADVETYIQIYNAIGFLMHIETDWAMKVILNAKKPVMAIKPLAAGRLIPQAGLPFVWNTLREKDMVVIGTTTPEEAREVIDISMELLDKRIPNVELQKTRSKKSLQ